MTAGEGGEGFTSAVRLFEAGRVSEAESACWAILAATPGDVDALNLLAVTLCCRGEFGTAIPFLQRILAGQPTNLQALRTLGDALEACGEPAAAAEAFAFACAIRPDDAKLHAKLGASLLHSDRPADADRAIATAIELCRAKADLPADVGRLLIDLNRAEDIAEAARLALAHRPQQPHLHATLGLALMRRGQIDEALGAYGRAASLDPTQAAGWSAEAAYEMAAVLRARGHLAAAAAALQEALALRPDFADAHNELGRMHDAVGRIEPAIGCFRRAIELAPTHVAAHVNLGGALREAEHLEEAVEVLQAATRLAPTSREAFNNLGQALHDLGRIEEAIAAYDQALACPGAGPDGVNTRLNRALTILLNGDLAGGFAEYEARRAGPRPTYRVQAVDLPEWAGEDLAGRTILLVAEQGFGDTLQFCRYVPLVQALGARVVLQVQEPLVALLSASLPGATVVGASQPPPPFDCHHPLMSLPWRLGTTLRTLPATVPYLVADPGKVAAWREQLAGARGLKVGLVWAGNPTTRHDRQRSLPAAALLAHVPAAGVSLFSLQKETRPGDAAALAAHGGVTDLAPALHDFSDTAAAVSALDLVVSVDSAVAHLAGALARPAWVLIPHALDWRWLRDRDDSPWYPSLRLFRQRTPRAWPEVLARLGAALRQTADAGT